VSGSYVEVLRDTYVDSVVLMRVSRTMQGAAGVNWANALMATPANLDLLRDAGVPDDELPHATSNDLIVAALADQAEDAQRAVSDALAGIGSGSGSPPGDPLVPAAGSPRTLDAALERLPEANIAIVSVPGPYATLEARRAIAHGLHVLLFSDNIPLEDEVALKSAAAARGLLLMGPGAGTAVIGGAALAFANMVRPGPVRVVAAAGTGAQEVMTLLHRWGTGISDVIGVGGRDVTQPVGGRMLQAAIGASSARDHAVTLIVSKPPDPQVVRSVLGGLDGRTTVCAFLGLDDDISAPQGVSIARTLEEAALLTLDALGRDRPDLSAGLAKEAEEATSSLPPSRRAVRGVFSGGTLCYESMVVLAPRLGEIRSNTPLRAGWGLPAPDGAHVCLDLGEEEYTRGRPHPMIDPLAREERMRRDGDDPTTAVVLLDVVLGHGAHDDPAGTLAPIVADITRRADGPAVVAHVLGTDEDPQPRWRQVEVLREAGCLVAPSAARAALLAAAIASRRPLLVEESP
jgi:FdrA protein